MSIKTKTNLKVEADANINTNGTNAITGALHNAMLTNTFDSVVSIIDAENVAGVKTFGSFPVTPSSAPTTDYQVANKKYVDDNISSKTYSQTAVATVANTVVLTSLLGTGVGTRTITANTLAVGDVIRMRQYGVVTNNTVSSEDLKFQVVAGAVTLGSDTGSIPSGFVDAVYELRAQFTVTTIGVGGAVLFTGSVHMHDVSQSTWLVSPLTATSSITLNTTIDEILDIECQWGKAEVALSVSSINTLLETLT